MSLTAFPDILGPIYVSKNGEPKQLVYRRRLNLIGAAAADNPTRRRTDVSIDGSSLPAVTLTTAQVGGTWFPALDDIASAALVRLSANGGGVTLTGLGSSADSIRPIKFLTNVGSAAIAIVTTGATPQQIRTSAITLNPNATVRATWDSVDRVYRIAGTPETASSYVILNAQRVGHAGNDVLNPTE